MTFQPSATTERTAPPGGIANWGPVRPVRLSVRNLDLKCTEIRIIGGDNIARPDGQWHNTGAGGDDLALAQHTAKSAEFIGQPGQRNARIAEHVGAAPLMHDSARGAPQHRMCCQIARPPCGCHLWPKHKLIGAGGERLSGGERRRLGLARAYLRRAPWLLLDEPTEGLDAQTEAAVVEALERRLTRLRQGVVIASHRPAPLMLCAKNLIVASSTDALSDGLGTQADSHFATSSVFGSPPA